MAALAVLFSEVDETYRAASANRYLLGESVVMKYMLLIYIDEQALTETVRGHCYEESTQLTHELNARGQYLAANPLHPTATATSVRVRDGNPIITDGPFAETREQLGGYFLIDARGSRRGHQHRRANSRSTPGHRRDPAGHGNSGPADGLMTATGRCVE